MKRQVWLGLWAILSLALFVEALGAAEPHNVNVYREPGRFGGWPANHGMWSWGNELLVGFSAGYFKDNGPDRHAIDHDKPEEHLLARSLDGGETWKIENPAAKGALIPRGKKGLHGTELPGVVDRPWVDCPGGIEFTHPDFAMTLRMSDNNGGESRFFYSTDRGHNWQGPFKFPMLGLPGISCRTDYIVNGPHDCLVFSTAAKSTGGEGRPFCARTIDGGKTWKFQGWIAPEPPGYSIMPSTARTHDGLFSAVRERTGDKSWIDGYFSGDMGVTWEFRSKPVPDTGEGSPAALVRLRDGRLCINYGVRAKPFGMRARLSSDDGKTWGDEITLRADGGGRDLGYPRAVERPDGKVVVVYYYNDDPKQTRYIAATIWDPPHP